MSKHHYLPEFYLKGFTNVDGQFMIYLVKKGIFKKNGKFFSPASHFFLPDDNMVITNGEKDDFLEENYSRLEGYVAKVLEKIKAVEANFGLDDLDVVLLQYFAAELFWRLPAQRELIGAVNNVDSLKKLGVAVIDKSSLREMNSERFESMAEDNPAHLKFLRAILPATTYWDLMDCTWPVSVLTFPKNLPAICSDNPVILRNPEKVDVYRDDLILPLAENKVMFRIRNMSRKFASTVKFHIDMLLLVQARDYVCCTDQEYVHLLASTFDENYGTAEVLRKKIFQSLDAEMP